MLRKLIYTTAAFASMALVVRAQEETPDHRLRASADVFREIMAAPDKGCLLYTSRCV